MPSFNTTSYLPSRRTATQVLLYPFLLLLKFLVILYENELPGRPQKTVENVREDTEDVPHSSTTELAASKAATVDVPKASTSKSAASDLVMEETAYEHHTFSGGAVTGSFRYLDVEKNCMIDALTQTDPITVVTGLSCDTPPSTTQPTKTAIHASTQTGGDHDVASSSSSHPSSPNTLVNSPKDPAFETNAEDREPENTVDGQDLGSEGQNEEAQMQKPLPPNVQAAQEFEQPGNDDDQTQEGQNEVRAPPEAQTPAGDGRGVEVPVAEIGGGFLVLTAPRSAPLVQESGISAQSRSSDELAKLNAQLEIYKYMLEDTTESHHKLREEYNRLQTELDQANLGISGLHDEAREGRAMIGRGRQELAFFIQLSAKLCNRLNEAEKLFKGALGNDRLMRSAVRSLRMWDAPVDTYFWDVGRTEAPQTQLAIEGLPSPYSVMHDVEAQTRPSTPVENEADMNGQNSVFGAGVPQSGVSGSKSFKVPTAPVFNFGGPTDFKSGASNPFRSPEHKAKSSSESPKLTSMGGFDSSTAKGKQKEERAPISGAEGSNVFSFSASGGIQKFGGFNAELTGASNGPSPSVPAQDRRSDDQKPGLNDHEGTSRAPRPIFTGIFDVPGAGTKGKQKEQENPVPVFGEGKPSQFSFTASGRPPKFGPMDPSNASSGPRPVHFGSTEEQKPKKAVNAPIFTPEFIANFGSRASSKEVSARQLNFGTASPLNFQPTASSSPSSFGQVVAQNEQSSVESSADKQKQESTKNPVRAPLFPPEAFEKFGSAASGKTSSSDKVNFGTASASEKKLDSSQPSFDFGPPVAFHSQPGASSSKSKFGQPGARIGHQGVEEAGDLSRVASGYGADLDDDCDSLSPPSKRTMMVHQAGIEPASIANNKDGETTSAKPNQGFFAPLPVQLPGLDTLSASPRLSSPTSTATRDVQDAGTSTTEEMGRLVGAIERWHISPSSSSPSSPGSSSPSTPSRPPSRVSTPSLKSSGPVRWSKHGNPMDDKGRLYLWRLWPLTRTKKNVLSRILA